MGSNRFVINCWTWNDRLWPKWIRWLRINWVLFSFLSYRIRVAAIPRMAVWDICRACRIISDTSMISTIIYSSIHGLKWCALRTYRKCPMQASRLLWINGARLRNESHKCTWVMRWRAISIGLRNQSPVYTVLGIYSLDEASMLPSRNSKFSQIHYYIGISESTIAIIRILIRSIRMKRV